MAAFIRFGGTCLTHKWLLLSSLSNRAIFFFSKNVYLKNHPKKHVLHSHFHDERKFHHCFSSCFHCCFLRLHSSKTFLYRRNLKILISITLFRGEKSYYLPHISREIFNQFSSKLT